MATVVIAVQALIVFIWRNSASLIIANLLTQPFFVAVVTAFTYADVRGDLSPGATWLRVLERAWAVVLIDLLVDLIGALGLESIVTPDLLQKLLGAAVIVIAVSLVFADVHATVVDDAEPWWLLVPRSFGASMAIAWQGATFARAIVLFVLSQLLPELVVGPVQKVLDAYHVTQSALWSNAVAIVLLLPLVQALCTMVYLDAAGMDRSALDADGTVK